MMRPDVFLLPIFGLSIAIVKRLNVAKVKEYLACVAGALFFFIYTKLYHSFSHIFLPPFARIIIILLTGLCVIQISNLIR